MSVARSLQSAVLDCIGILWNVDAGFNNNCINFAIEER